jgi:hypothetical protein
MSTRKHLNPSLVRNENGFAIPIAIGMGLIMVLLATTAILRSQDDRVAALNKRATGQSLVAAESGIIQVQDFLNRYRAAAGYKACIVWHATDGTCTDTGTTNASWKLASTLPTILNASCSAESTLATAQSTVQSWATKGWKQVDSSDLSKGEFRVLDYDGTGSLTVQGVVNRNQTGEAISEVQVRFPLIDTRQEQVSSLWVKTSVSDSPQINSDVMGPCTGTIAASFPTGSDRTISRTQMQMPSVPPAPTSSTSTQFYSLTNISSIPGKELPRSTSTITDLPDSTGTYKYIVDSFDGSLKITPGKSVRIWVTGNIDIQNQIVINQCSATGAYVGCSPFDFRVYGTASSGTLKMNRGTYVCDTFFLLPTYSVTFYDEIASPTPPVQDCGEDVTGYKTKNTGVYWVNTWSGGSSAGVTLDPPRATWASAIVQPPIRIGPWQKWDPRSTSTVP